MNYERTHEFSFSTYNQKNLGGTKLIKKDSYDNKPLFGVWIFLTKENKTIGWNNYQTDCVSWKTTNKSGEISFQDLEAGRYYIWELNQLKGYNNNFQKVGYVDIESGNTVCSLKGATNNKYIYCNGNTIYNKQYRDLQIKKVDKDTGELLQGVGFKIYSRVENKWIYMTGTALSYTNLYSNATEFYTKSNGLTDKIEDLPLGIYDIYEINLGSNSDWYQLDTVTNVPIEPNKTDTINAIKKTCTLSRINNNQVKLMEFEFENKKVFINLSGYVWVDKQTSKGSERNNLYKTNLTNYIDDNDVRLDEVIVRLRKTDGTIERQTITSNGGTYSFTRVLRSVLGDGGYYIEFEYDGLKYTNVIPYINESSGSKAKEKASDRTQLNTDFSVIEGGENKAGTKNSQYGYTIDSNGNKKYDLTYTKTGYTSILNNSGTFKMHSDTTSANYLLKDHFTSETKEIANINLGLYERDQPNIAIVQDIQNVRIGVNDYWHTYNYLSRFRNISSNENMFDPGVKFGEENENKTYSRAIYEADYKYENPKASNKINAFITYKITIKNESTQLKAWVYGINDYFDINYDIVLVGSNLTDKGEIERSNNNIRYERDKQYNDNYKKTMIYEVDKNNNRTHMLIEPGSVKELYIQFILDKTAINKIVTNEEVLGNVVEIKNYSIRDMSNSAYAGIDCNSNPNNCTPGTKSTYEDDADYAPGFKITLQSKRTIAGKVFLDSTTGDLNSGSIRQGDGQYLAREKGINNVEVVMYNSNGSIAQIYDESSDTWKEARAITQGGGLYEIGGYIPGDYYLEFIWGNKRYKVQDYKGTVQDKDILDANSSNLEWYKTTTPRYSDAQDNWSTRVAIDKQTELMTNANKEAINIYNNAKLTKIDNTQEDLITKMSSTTLPFKVNLEYNTGATNSINEYALNSDGTIKMNGKYVVKSAGYKNEIKNIDFGIVERARQILQLEKVLKSAKVTLVSKNIIINVHINENGEIRNKPEYVSYVPKSAGADALLKFEIDQEIINGATLEMEYGFKVTNKSELDYVDEDFYKYGIEPSINKQTKMVTLTPSDVIDYLDNVMSTNVTGNESWTLLTTADSISNLGLLSENAANAAKTNLKNGTIKVLKTSSTLAELKPEDNTSTTNKDERAIEASLRCSKLLSESDESIKENHAEIIRVTKSGGATLKTTPGNYIPGDSSTSELDNSESEPLVIIPPTGLNKDIIAYTILAICSLGIIGIGVVVIKKYVIG